jgi:hypothetical protein
MSLVGLIQLHWIYPHAQGSRNGRLGGIAVQCDRSHQVSGFGDAVASETLTHRRDVNGLERTTTSGC